MTPGQLYGVLAAGTGRRLIIPAVDHPQEHFSNAGVGAAVDWFQRTLAGAATPKPPADQIWFGKEIGTLIGFVGCVILMLGTFELALAAPPFRVLQRAPEGQPARRGVRWFVALVLAAAIPALTFYPFMKAAPAVFFAPFALTGTLPFALGAFPEQITDQLAVWAIGAGLISFALSFALGRTNSAGSHRWLAAAGAAMVSVGMGYLALAVVDAAFKTDFRFWVLALKPLDGAHFALFVVYLPLFLVFSLLALRGFGASLGIAGEGWVAALVTGALGFSLGFVVLLAAQYLHMATTGLLLTPDEPLNTIIAFQFIPVLAVLGVIAAFTWRLTADFVPGAFVCALFLTWYVVAGTAIFPPSTSALAPRPAASAAPANAAPAPSSH